MAYLDKDGIPRVDERTQQRNDDVDRVTSAFQDVKSHLSYVYATAEQTVESVKRDEELSRTIKTINDCLDWCIARMNYHIIY